MKKSTLQFSFAVILSVVLFSATTLKAQWVAQTPPAGATSLYSVYAISPAEIACAGAGMVIRSVDSGLTWTAPIQLGGVNLYTIHSGINTSWLSIALNSGWRVKVTTYGGVNLTYSNTDSIMALHFNTPSCATAVGLLGKIETTCDSGATWTVRSFTGLALNSVWYASSTKGVACGVFGGIRRTLDGGATWANVSCPVTQNLNAVTFADTLTGYIAGNSGTFLKTIDGGATWTSMPLGISNNINGVYFVSADTGYIVGTSGLIKRTVNGGTTWSTMNSGTTLTLRSVHFADSRNGWVCGDGGTILKYCPTLAASGTITGSTSVCAGDTLTYTAPAVANATGYTWTLPSGWAGGSLSNTITVVTGYTGGNISFAPNNSCGSGTPITLAVTNGSPNIPVISQSSSTLTSSAASGNQWNLNGVPITGATSQSYTFTANGTYTVTYSAGGCASTSLPVTITNAGINESAFNAERFSVIPNPSTDHIIISIDNIGEYHLSIVDLLGKTLLQQEFNSHETTVNLSAISKGVYFVKLSDKDRNSIFKKIIVE